MEKSPLFLAHAHANHAVLETKRSNPVAASEEHDLAAAEFAVASLTTRDSEALRILNLLERHHKKLGHILKSRHEKPAIETSAEAKGEIVPIRPASRASEENAPSDTAEVPHPPRLSKPSRATARDLSSSIASNLASARGIPRDRLRKPTPISPTVSAQHAGGNFAKEQGSPGPSPYNKIGPDRPSNQQSRKPSWAPPSGHGEEKDQVEPSEATSDVPFQQFYATFESLISKLSAPLAFAGLPLTTASSNKPSSAEPHLTTKSHRPKTPPITSNSPIDYSQLISRAALRAVRDRNPSTSMNPAESFYVVPTTGGTISYAEIMSRAERESNRHHRTLSGISETTSDDFVDARSTILNNPGPKAIRKAETQAKFNGKTMEELSMENQALRVMSDNLSKRLQVFEMSAQSSSAALAQSIRNLQRSPMSTPENSQGKRDKGAAARISELEAIRGKNEKELARRREENSKLKDVVSRYREKWEKLKEGARARRQDPSAPGSTATAGNRGGGRELDDDPALLAE